MKQFKLNEHKIKPGFVIPDHYFEHFEQAMMPQIHLESKVIPLHSNRKSWWYAAAAVLVLALTIPAINTFTASNEPDTVALDNYFAYSGLSEDQLVEVLDPEDIAKIKIDYNLEDAAIEEALQSRAIENYILD